MKTNIDIQPLVEVVQNYALLMDALGIRCKLMNHCAVILLKKPTK